MSSEDGGPGLNALARLHWRLQLLGSQARDVGAGFMRFIAILALAAATLTAAAWAQEATTAPAAPLPPSACAAVVQAPSPPDGATSTRAQMEAAVAAFDAWRAHEQTTLDCRRAEVDALNAQARARADEYRAAQVDNTARAAAFQAQIDIFQARPERARR